MNPSELNDIPRIIGQYSGKSKGPLLFVTAGIHGNEPSGIMALKKVFQELDKIRPDLSGTIVGVSGNRKALAENVRYIDEDLNRTWTEDNINNPDKDSHEQKEMFEIIDTLNQLPADHYTKRIFLDCHTTSSASVPYISVQEVNDNDEWAHHFPTYIVRGFSDIITGDIDHYLSRIGMTGFVFEGGEHTDIRSVENHEGMIWLALCEACGLDLQLIPTYPECVEKFSVKNSPSQKTFEIVHRHGLSKDDVFAMEPGYENFQKITKGEHLATQNGQRLVSEWDAHIFLPLYQASGNDGFFVIQEVGK